MNKLTISLVNLESESRELDQLLWEVLWMPLGFPRDIRNSFKLDRECLEIVAKAEGSVIGGLVANWITNREVEIRHLAIKTEVQNKGVGQKLVESLIEVVVAQGCVRIHTIARNMSVAFFKRLGFTNALGTPPEHPDFIKHGITFEILEKNVERIALSDTAKPP